MWRSRAVVKLPAGTAAAGPRTRSGRSRPRRRTRDRLCWLAVAGFCRHERRHPSGLLPSYSLKGGLIAVGGLNLGGGIDPVHNAVSVAELAVERGAATLLVPISARRQLNDLSDDMATKISVLFYADAREALIKALGD